MQPLTTLFFSPSRPLSSFSFSLSSLPEKQVGPIVDDVRQRGDDAVRELTAKFDKAELGKDSPPCVPIAELLPALQKANLSKEVTDAFDVALSNIVRFHEAQRSPDLTLETMPGVSCRRVTRAINRVGVYVPGGTAVLPSSALMLAAPARVAGCATIVLATPPRPDGSVSPEVLYCAFKAGATHVLRAGGAQAVAALAWGTASTPKVDKILGPGNQFVTAAKMALQNSEAMVAIDMPAGPSEVLVIADAEAPLAHVAADLLSQAEHGPDSQVVLVALPGVDVEALVAEVTRQAEALPRGATAFKALDHSCVVKVRSREEAASFSNRYAPEHLIVNVARRRGLAAAARQRRLGVPGEVDAGVRRRLRERDQPRAAHIRLRSHVQRRLPGLVS